MEILNTDLAKKGVQRKMKPKTPPIWNTISQQEFEKLIDEHYGIVTVICNILDCTFTQFHRAISHWNLQSKLDEAKRNLVSLAEQVVLDKMSSKSDSIALKAAEITLKSKAGRDAGWGSEPQIQQQINIASDEEKRIQIQNIFGIQS